jgi:hypothetical protein
MLLVASAPATNTPHDPVVAWLRQLGPSWTLSERTFARRLAIAREGASRVNDCTAIGGSVGEKDWPRVGRVSLGKAHVSACPGLGG